MSEISSLNFFTTSVKLSITKQTWNASILVFEELHTYKTNRMKDLIKTSV